MPREDVDPELRPVLEIPMTFDLSHEGIKITRQYMDAAAIPPEDFADEHVAVERREISSSTDSHSISCVLYWPKGAEGRLPVFLNMHGGGYVVGTAADNAAMDTRTAIELQCLVVSPEYRLAPETCAPGAAEDCYDVLQWLYKQADELNLDRSRMAIGGMSAGAGLAAAVALMARDRKLVDLCFQLLVYPMLDDRTAVRPIEELRGLGEFVWTADQNADAWRHFLGHEPGTDNVPYYHAPARADDLSGLPATYIDVGTLDLFLDENIAFARHLMRSGVPTEFHVYPAAYHGFEMAVEARVPNQALQNRRKALARAFEGAVKANAPD